jgi:peptidyl-prolyl cis-trans isomerase D
MLRFFRAFAQSWFGPVIMGLIVVAFGVLGGGVRNVLSGRIENSVVAAGSHQVSSADFQKIFDRYKQQVEEQSSQTFPLEDFVKSGRDKAMLQELAGQSAYAELLSRSGVRPSDDVMVSELARAAKSGQSPMLSRLFDPITGKFDETEYARLLQGLGLTRTAFEQEFRDDIANQDVGAAIAQGYGVPRVYAAIQTVLALESRDITYFVVPISKAQVPPPPTDAQLTQILAKFPLPERRKLTIVRFSAKAMAPSMSVDPAAVKQQFDAQPAKYAKPETRSLVEIPLGDPRQAQIVAAALQRGEDPQGVAKSLGSDAVAYVDQPQSAIADAKAGAAAFAMKAGDVSGPVQGDFKTVILKVTKVTPGQPPNLEAATPQIEAQLRQSAAVDKVYDLSQKYEDLRQGGASPADAAAKLGVAAVTVGPLTADGKDLVTGQVAPIVSQKLLKAAFSLQQGGDSDIEQDADKGEYFDVHVDQVIAAGPPRLDEPGVRQAVTQAFVRQSILESLAKLAAAAVKDIQSGQSFEAVAAKNGGEVAHQLGLQRIAAQQYEATLGAQLLGAIFAAKQGQVFDTLSQPLKGVVVARLDAVKPADARQAAAFLDIERRNMTQGYLEGLQGAVRQAAFKDVKPSTDVDLARNVMGVDATMLARINAKPAKGAALAK